MSTPEERAKWAAYSREYYKRNPDKVRAARRRWYKDNPEKSRVASERWAKANPQKSKEIDRRAKLKKKYGITPDEFRFMFRKVGGLCPICGIEMKQRGGSLDVACVDHNHETDEVRGLICRSCNSMLGYARDNPDTLYAGGRYLKKKIAAIGNDGLQNVESV